MKNKKLILAASLLAAALTTTSVTLAFLTTKTEEVVNTFTPSEVKIEVEEPGWETTGVKENVTIKNTGDTTAYIRAAVVVNWLNSEGYIVYPDEEPNYVQNKEGVYFTLQEKNRTIDSGWYLHTDGYYYYMDDVAPGDETEVLIKKWEVTYPTEGEYYTLQVEILAQAVQSVPVEDNVVTAAFDLWGVALTVNEDGTITAIS